MIQVSPVNIVEETLRDLIGLLLIAVGIVDSKFSLDINVGIHDTDVTITHSGFEINIIGHREIELFNIGNANIRNAVKGHYHWSPSNVYLKSPTPWGDLFQNYNWEQVSRVLTVKSARLKTITKKPVIVSQDFDKVSYKTIKILFIVAVGIVDSKFSLDINVGIHDTDVTITHSSFEINIIGHREIELFNIGNANIRNAVKGHYHWSPSNVYLKSPTPWGDLFQKYNWEQVSRVLTVKSARLKTITKKPVIVSQDFDNVSYKTIKVNTGISQTVENTISTSWTKTKEQNTSQLNYWASEEQSETITIGTTSGVETELQPGHAATAIFVNTASNKDDVIVHYYGIDRKIITDMEVKLFNITEGSKRFENRT
ncbi:unnamed protein product [Parnassius apollo]|uniref:(apollo) hypothetical protein n=1 Tax=Parnassius apollo TaxID=110799 RepID=A0A8S3YBE3_PARAO|nr:unnamed protein product [Parnassius apollo]